MLIMTRRMTFSAAKADWISTLSPEANERLFGPLAGPEPYGHNYVLDVGVIGNIDPRTGLLVNIKEIDQVVKQNALVHLDRKYLNRQVPFFADKAPSLENLIGFLLRALRPHLPPSVRLHSLRVEATGTLWAEWRDRGLRQNATLTGGALTGAGRKKEYEGDEKEENAMIYVTRQYEFSASHRLNSPHLSPEENRELFGKCNYESGHGHNYELEVTVKGPVQMPAGRVLDTNLLDEMVHREVVDRYDHRHLNLDIEEFHQTVPSAEEIARTIWLRLVDGIPAPARLYKVLLRETPRNIFEYYGEEDPIR